VLTAPPVASLDDAADASPAEPAEALVGLRRSSVFIPELESIRGIAILLVFAFHVDGFARFPFSVVQSTPLSLAFVRAGFTGVDLFFVLSGFLLSLPFLTDGAGGRRVVVRDYAYRRALRILPLYYVAVVVGTVLTAQHLAELRWAFPYLLFLNSFAGVRTPLDPYSSVWWSLATEVQFYLLLPVLPLFLRSARGRWIGATLVCGYVAAYAAMVRGLLYMPSVEGQMALINSVFGRGPLFVAGVAAAALYRRFGERIRAHLAGTRWLERGGADVLLFALVLANAVFLKWLVSIGPARQMGSLDQPWHVVNGALWAAFILVLLLAPLRAKSLFSNAVLARLGILSYSIYMIHAPFMHLSLRAIRRTWPGQFNGWSVSSALVIAALTAVCLALSALSYRFVERPFLVRKGRLDS
jgi:peptidoglycan/LPS O-acetylase OafA/YrhL